jgi:hypothetical protein
MTAANHSENCGQCHAYYCVHTQALDIATAGLGRPIVTQDESLDNYAARAVTVDQADLAGEYSRVGADLAYWGMVAADAEQDYQAAKDALRVVEAQALLASHAAFQTKGVKTTAAQAEARVELIPEVQAARQAVTQADGTRRRMRAICDGIAAKQQALISLGAQLRRELDSTRFTT